MRIAHLSDLHFFVFDKSPLQFFSKRFIGNFNGRFLRRKKLNDTLPFQLIDTLSSLNVDLVLITGDFTTTASKKEFEKGSLFIQSLKQKGLKVIALPGNHDLYTRSSAKKKLFYRFFDPIIPFREVGGFTLENDGVALYSLENNWWVITLDTAKSNSLLESGGCFTPEHEKKLVEALEEVPPHGCIILANHFPLFSCVSDRQALKGREMLKNVLSKEKRILLYLNGHTHRLSIADLRGDKLPIILDSGSISNRSGNWSMIDLYKSRLQITPFTLSSDGFSWSEEKMHAFSITEGDET